MMVISSQDKSTYTSIRNHQLFKDMEFDNLYKARPPEVEMMVISSQDESVDWAENNRPGLGNIELQLLLGLKLGSDGTGNTDQQEPKKTSQKRRNLCDVSPEELVLRLAEQGKENKWHTFVEGNLILKQGFIFKRKGLFPRRRMFLLTLGPHLYYVDPVNMILKGQIPWNDTIEPEAKNFKTFFVHTPKRIYYLEDPEGYALEWCNAINEVKEFYFPK